MTEDSVKPEPPDGANRRRFLSMIGAIGVAGLAGCGGDDEDTPTDTDDTPTDTETSTDTDDTPTDTKTATPDQSFASGVDPIITFSGGGSVQPGESTTLTGTIQNPYLFSIRNIQIELSPPSDDWSLSTDGETSFDELATQGSVEITWEITPPEGINGEFTISGSISYESQTDQAETQLSESIKVFDVDVDPIDGLEAYFPLDSETATNRVTGTEVEVLGEPNRNATGIVDGAWEFAMDGSAAISGEDLPLNGEEATVGAWINPTDHASFGRFYQVGGSPNESAAGTGGWELDWNGLNDDDGPQNDLLIAGGGRVDGTPDLSLETWYFLVTVRDGGEYRLHLFDESGELDASPVTGGVGSPPTSSGEPLVMMMGDGGETAGRIDEVYGYSRALSEEEVTDLYVSAGGST